MPEKLKKGWTRVSFGDVVRLCRERSADPAENGFERYVGLEHLEPGDLKIQRWGNTADGTTFMNLFRAGQVLFGKRRAYQRKVAVADFDGVCSGDIYVLESADPKHLLPDLLPFICQTDSFFEHAVGTSAGSLSPRTNWESLASFEFNLPPVDEQRRIAHVLSQASSVVSSLMTARDRCQSALRAILSAWFARTLDSAQGVTLGAVLQEVTDKGYEGLPVLSVTIDGSVVRRKELGRHVSDATGEAKCIRVQPGDVAYNTMRLWQGSVGIVKEEGLISPAYTVLRIQRTSLPPGYLLAMLRSPAFQREYRRLVRGVASDRWRIYYKDLASLRVQLPSSEIVRQQMCILDSMGTTSEGLTRRLQQSSEFLSELRRRLVGS